MAIKSINFTSGRSRFESAPPISLSVILGKYFDLYKPGFLSLKSGWNFFIRLRVKWDYCYIYKKQQRNIVNIIAIIYPSFAIF